MIGRARISGVAAIRAALDAGESLGLVLIRESPDRRSPDLANLLIALGERGVPIREESEREMRRMSTTVRADSEGGAIVALAAPPVAEDLATLMAQPGLVLLLAGLRYPGNVGFILRSAEVAGAAGVVVANDWQGDQWAEALRVGIRADRFMSVLRAPATEAVYAARAANRRVLAVETEGSCAPWEADLVSPALVVVGSETEGVPTSILSTSDACLRIPARGFIPSYNVQAAVGIVLGEWLRQSS